MVIRPVDQRCDNCGFVCSNAAFFRREAGGLVGAAVNVCEGCHPYKPTDTERRLFRSLLLSPLLWLLLAVPAFSASFAEGIGVLTMLIAATVTMPLRLIVHEAGHALMARGVGYLPTAVALGSGPVVGAVRLAGVRVEWRLYFFGGGLTHFADLRDRLSRWRRALTLIAGPAANALCAALAAWLSLEASGGPGAASALLAPAFTGIAITQAFTAIYNLIPTRPRDGRVGSDGRQLLALLKPQPRNEDAERFRQVRGLMSLRRWDEAAQTALAGANVSPMGLVFLSQALHCLSRGPGDRVAVECYLGRRAAVDTVGTGDDETFRQALAWLRANVAWSALKAGDDRLLGLVEDYSAEAISVLPEAPEMKGTRGAWLIEKGAHDEGELLLLDAARSATDPLDRADFCGFLAQGCRERGDGARAASFEGLSRHLRSAELA